jgi:hypothetical protein
MRFVLTADLHYFRIFKEVTNSSGVTYYHLGKFDGFCSQHSWESYILKDETFPISWYEIIAEDMNILKKKILRMLNRRRRPQPRYVIFNGDYWEIDQDHGDHYTILPLGGGLMCTIPKISVESLCTEVPSNMVKCFARFEDSERFECMTNIYKKWNGWAIPHFSDDIKDEIVRICLETNNQIDCLYRDQASGLWCFDGWCWEVEDEDGNRLTV